MILTEDNTMKIIQIIVKKDRIYGLCDEGQLWYLDGDIDYTNNIWVLVPIKCFFGKNPTGPINLIQLNILDQLKINLTKE